MNQYKCKFRLFLQMNPVSPEDLQSDLIQPGSLVTEYFAPKAFMRYDYLNFIPNMGMTFTFGANDLTNYVCGVSGVTFHTQDLNEKNRDNVDMTINLHGLHCDNLDYMRKIGNSLLNTGWEREPKQQEAKPEILDSSLGKDT